MTQNIIIKKDSWQHLKNHTPARIALGRVGQSIPTQEILNFGLSHALAKDAIYTELNINFISEQLNEKGVSSLVLKSMAESKKDYLMNPNLGRRLNDKSKKLLQEQPWHENSIALIFADGLSATAVHNHAIPLFLELNFLLKDDSRFNLSPVLLAKHARVALSDEVGEKLNCIASLIFIGERPGLSSPDSLGVYITWNPKIGRLESERNCISNIRHEGLSYKLAAYKIFWILQKAKELNATGVILKDESPSHLVLDSDLQSIKLA
ncbi:ethanolamine ammonia-lyase subunit EutC [Pigmentibacter ruber]|uniref:ethanolamine ammonia-lyase subunit EutC n=1 Tax=Pigmentibacter ruber TaxID=2683196 RepID=UPI00131D479C|nr:ethanolamine ammonia-lyase subunit EutC [Pigmentibacter ruber]